YLRRHQAPRDVSARHHTPHRLPALQQDAAPAPDTNRPGTTGRSHGPPPPVRLSPSENGWNRHGGASHKRIPIPERPDSLGESTVVTSKIDSRFRCPAIV